MKKIIIITIMALTGGVLFANHAAAGVVENRMHQQRHRIRHGIITGKLTRSEITFLRLQQRRIHHMQKIAWADGRLTNGERRRIEKLQNKASKDIYRFKHNHRLGHRSYRF